MSRELQLPGSAKSITDHSPIQIVLRLQYALSKRIRCVVLFDRNGNPSKHGTFVVTFGDKVDSRSTFAGSRREDGFVNVSTVHPRTAKAGQRGRMNVYDPFWIPSEHPAPEQFGVTCKHDHVDAMLFEARQHGEIRITVGASADVNGRHASVCSAVEGTRGRVARDHQDDVRRQIATKTGV